MWQPNIKLLISRYMDGEITYHSGPGVDRNNRVISYLPVNTLMKLIPGKDFGRTETQKGKRKTIEYSQQHFPFFQVWEIMI